MIPSTVSIRRVLKRQKLLFNFLFFKTGNHCNVPVFPLKKLQLQDTIFYHSIVIFIKIINIFDNIISAMANKIL